MKTLYFFLYLLALVCFVVAAVISSPAAGSTRRVSPLALIAVGLGLLALVFCIQEVRALD